MSPKIATHSLALLSLTLTLTLTLTFATANGGCKNSLPDILESYDLPRVLFPEPAQKTFTCTPLEDDSAVSVKFTLQRPCTVSRTAFVVKNVLTCAQEVSAIVSHRQLSHIQGITVSLYISIPLIHFNFPFPYLPEIMTVTGAKVFYDKDGVKKLQFMAKEGNSPAFPIKDFPHHPPTCDSRHTILGYFFAADDDTTSNQEVYNDKYGGRPLFPLHVVA